MKRGQPQALGGSAGPFTVFEFTFGSGAHIQLHGNHFATFDDAEGARRMVDILNAAVLLAGEGHLVSSRPGYAAERIAALVAKALGGATEFGSFTNKVVA